MPSRLKFVVAYDGRPFAGWQSQANGNTIQDILEQAFANVSGETIRVHGSGRTDAGVHSLAQVAHVDVPSRSLPPETWTAALNASLPSAIRVLRCAYAPAAFHARFTTRGKLYRYRIWNDRYLSPFEEGRAWHVTGLLDLATFESEAQQYLGKHDFAGFAANRGKPTLDTVRTITSVRVRKSGKCITVEFAGDGFLYKMVRLMVGALVSVARGKSPVGEIRERLQRPHAFIKHARPAAPACGLYLVRVLY
ncbi:MAG: tRNA pseudouridine(38-40) synthase TruA [Verrucomicrobiota bacterium]|nr:tRNA pseudouridine(38-40) synthase TruA [Verrucomicrobiota bacterium]